MISHRAIRLSAITLMCFIVAPLLLLHVSQQAARASAPTENPTQLKRKLDQLSAGEGEARGSAAKWLQVVLVEFRPGLDNRVNNSPTNDFRPIELDISEADDTVVLVIADKPIRWHVTTGSSWSWLWNWMSSQPRARVAFEGNAPLDLDAPQGVLAGYRIGAFGEPNVADPRDYIGMQDLSSVCSSISRWLQVFGHTGNIRLHAVNSPSTIRIKSKGHGAHGDGMPISVVDVKSAACARFYR